MTEYLVESKPAPILGRPPKLRGHENKEKKKAHSMHTTRTALAIEPRYTLSRGGDREIVWYGSRADDLWSRSSETMHLSQLAPIFPSELCAVCRCMLAVPLRWDSHTRASALHCHFLVCKPLTHNSRRVLCASCFGHRGDRYAFLCSLGGFSCPMVSRCVWVVTY